MGYITIFYFCKKSLMVIITYGLHLFDQIFNILKNTFLCYSDLLSMLETCDTFCQDSLINTK